MMKLFLEIFFLTSRAVKVKKKIYDITQANSEILHEFQMPLQHLSTKSNFLDAPDLVLL